MPSPWVTVPTDAVMVTASSPASAKVPVLVAVPPSSTVTLEESAPTVGATLLTINANEAVAIVPSLSVAVMRT